MLLFLHGNRKDNWIWAQQLPGIYRQADLGKIPPEWL
jgi:hypothetical protein